jgi:hypothetical protein
MNPYELHIQTSGGTWKQAELGNEAPAMSYQTNDIAELKDLRAGYSQNLKLPASKQNTEIFEEAGIAGIAARTPYRRLPCRLYCGVNTIAGEGSFIVLLKIATHFECQILSGNVDMFETLKNKQMSTLTDSENPKMPTVQITPENIGKSDEFYGFYISSFGKQTNITGKQIYDVGDLLPFVKIPAVLKLIFEEEKYKFESNALDVQQFQNCIMPVVLEKDSTQNFDFLTGKATIKSGANGGEKTIDTTASGWFTGHDTSDNRPGDSFTPDFKYKSGITAGKLVIKFTVKNMIGNLHVRIWDVTKEEYTNCDIFADAEITFDRFETLLIECKFSENPSTPIEVVIECLFSLSSESESLLLGYHAKTSSLGFKTRLDFFKAIAQAFGLFVHVDHKEKKVRAHTASYFYAQIREGKALDWSEKAVKTKSEQKFTFGNYGQKTHIRFVDNDPYETSDEILLTIDDQKLEPDKELFTLPFEAGSTVNYVIQSTNHKISSIPILYQDEKGKWSIRTGKPHLCWFSSTGDTVNLGSGTAAIYPIAQNLDGETLGRYFYGNLQSGILNSTLFIEEELMLTPRDIQYFNPLTPVYLEKYGYYFYVNKIKNFIAGKPTVCEMVRL